MNRTLLMLLLAAATTGATAARADDFHPRAGRFGEARHEPGREGWRGEHEGRGQHPGWRPGGHQELRRVERWVAGAVVPRWIPGSCFVQWGQTRCAPGTWQQQFVPPHLEVREEWVWVPGRR